MLAKNPFNLYIFVGGSHMFYTFLIFLQVILADVASPVEQERQNRAIDAFRVEEEAIPKDFTWELLNVVFALGLIIALLVAATWFMRKFMTGKMQQINETSVIKILDQRNISTRTSIYILEIYDKHIVVAETANSANAIAEFPIDDTPPKQFEDFMTRRPQ